MSTAPAARRWQFGAMLALAMLGWLPLVAQAQAREASIDEVKAAYLYRFARFVEWPDSAFATPDAPLVFGLVAADAVYAELARLLHAQATPGRPIVAKKLGLADSLDGIHLLFVGAAALPAVPWQPRIQGRPILFVGDRPQGLEAGTALNFVLAQDRLRFEASMPAIDRAGLRVSSRLLALAQRVIAAP